MCRPERREGLSRVWSPVYKAIPFLPSPPQQQESTFLSQLWLLIRNHMNWIGVASLEGNVEAQSYSSIIRCSFFGWIDIRLCQMVDHSCVCVCVCVCVLACDCLWTDVSHRRGVWIHTIFYIHLKCNKYHTSYICYDIICIPYPQEKFSTLSKQNTLQFTTRAWLDTAFFSFSAVPVSYGILGARCRVQAIFAG